MSLKLPTKSLNKKQITNIIKNYEDRFEAIEDFMRDFYSQPNFSGALVLEIYTPNDDDNMISKRYYMVTDFIVREPYVEFFHLVPTEDRDFDIRSFPLQGDLSTRKYIRQLENEDRWNKIYENIMMPPRIQWMGRFTYSKMIKRESIHCNINMPESEVVDLNKSKNKV